MEQFDAIIIHDAGKHYVIHCLKFKEKPSLDKLISAIKPLLGTYDILLTEDCSLEYSTVSDSYIIKGEHTFFKQHDSNKLPDYNIWDVVIKDVEPWIGGRLFFGKEMKTLKYNLMLLKNKITKEFIFGKNMTVISKIFLKE